MKRAFKMVADSGVSSVSFPAAAPTLETFGFKFSSGGAHLSRTMMLRELASVFVNVPQGSSTDDYRAAILQKNVLGKTTDSTRRESLRRLREPSPACSPGGMVARSGLSSHDSAQRKTSPIAQSHMRRAKMSPQTL